MFSPSPYELKKQKVKNTIDSCRYNAGKKLNKLKQSFLRNRKQNVCPLPLLRIYLINNVKNFL